MLGGHSPAPSMAVPVLGQGIFLSGHQPLSANSGTVIPFLAWWPLPASMAVPVLGQGVLLSGHQPLSAGSGALGTECCVQKMVFKDLENLNVLYQGLKTLKEVKSYCISVTVCPADSFALSPEKQTKYNFHIVIPDNDTPHYLCRSVAACPRTASRSRLWMPSLCAWGPR